MTAVSEYKTKIEEIQKRLDGANGHNGEQIGELKERLGTIRSSLLRKQEIIDAQSREIADLRDENGQLSDMLGQALAALDEQSKSDLQEVVQSFDSEFSGLLDEAGAEAVAAEAEAGHPGPDAEAEAAKANEDGPDSGGDQRDPLSEVAGEREPRSGDADPEFESESPALRRIMGRRRR